MPKFNASLLGDWIQIAASVGVILGIAILVIVGLAHTPQLIESDQTNQAFNEALKTQGVYLGEKSAKITKERQLQLRSFVEQNCTACHGTRMSGGLVPALSKANLRHLSVNAVTVTILNGRPENVMPPWETQLSGKDAYWIAELLKRGGIVE